MNKYKFLFFVLYSLILSLLYSADQKNEPSWVYISRAENFIEKGDYAQALIEAKNAKKIFIKEKLDVYYEEIRAKYKNKIAYELTQMLKDKEQSLIQNDDYPQYHEVIGDIYNMTGLISDAENEYKTALAQGKYFEFPQKKIEIKYKVASLYHKKMDFELEDITYREIVKDFFDKKPAEFWDRIKYNIKTNPGLDHVFSVYRIDGIEFLDALYKIGRRAALLQRKSEALYFLSISAVVWMTYYSSLIKVSNYDFQYTGPEDFINYVLKKRIFTNDAKYYLMDEILFFTGYVFLQEKQTKLKDHFFSLSVIFAQGTYREEEIKKRIEYFKKDETHILTYDEFLD